MKALVKTFFMMMLAGGVAVLMGTLLLHSHFLVYPLHFSLMWTIGRCILYACIIIFRNRLGDLLAKRRNLDSKEINSILPTRWKLAAFFAFVELFIIQGGLAYLVSHCVGWFA